MLPRDACCVVPGGFASLHRSAGGICRLDRSSLGEGSRELWLDGRFSKLVYVSVLGVSFRSLWLDWCKEIGEYLSRLARLVAPEGDRIVGVRWTWNLDL